MDLNSGESDRPIFSRQTRQSPMLSYFYDIMQKFHQLIESAHGRAPADVLSVPRPLSYCLPLVHLIIRHSSLACMLVVAFLANSKL